MKPVEATEKDLIQKNNTAFYLFDIGELKRRICYLREHLPRGTSLCYAVKANPFLVREISGAVDRLEICSPGEARICSSLGVPTRKMVISGVYKTPEVMEHMSLDNSFNGIFTVESFRQYELLSGLADKYDRRFPVLLRLTNQSQFGMDEDQIESILSGREKTARLHVLGIQFFSGTQKSSVKKLRRELEALDRFLTQLQETCGFTAEELEYGPGFPVAYFEEDNLDEAALLGEFCDAFNAMQNRPRLTLELGRSIAASCGNYYTHIVDIKQNGGQNYLITDGGMHQIVYFGQHMAMKQPMLRVAEKHAVNRDVRWNICGSLCTMNDILAKQVYLPDVSVGDTLCFENTGAYCMAEGISLFLSRELPAIWLLPENGRPVLARDPVNTEFFNTPRYERMV